MSILGGLLAGGRDGVDGRTAVRPYGEGKGAATIVASWQEGRPVYNETNFENLVTHGYRKNELIFACIAKTANTASQVELKVRNSQSKAELPQHPLKKLIQRPNPYMSEFDFWNAVIIYQKLAGRAAFEKVRSRGGQVVELWPLRPDWLAPVASSSKFISGYTYTPPGMSSVDLNTEDVLDFKLFDPLSQYNGWPPTAVAARVGDVDNSVTDFLKLFFEKGGVPMGLLKSKQRLMDAQVADIRRRWRERYGGYEKWIEPAVLDSDAEWLRTGLTFEEMGFDVLDARNEAKICAVMDVPAILVGAKVGLDRSTYSNYSEARLAWWEDGLVPLYENYVDVIENQLAPDFKGDFTAVWDFSRVWAFQEERAKLWRRAVEALNAGGITVNEFRREIGLQDDAGQDIYLRGGQAGEAEGSEPQSREEDEGEKQSTDSPLNYSRGYDDYTDFKNKAVGDKERARHERVIKEAMVGYLDGQMKRVVADVRKNGNG